MDFTPKLRIDRFAQLQPGDLYIFVHENGPCVALKVEDPANDGDKLIVPLGRLFPMGVTGPRLITPSGMTVIAYEKRYILPLPTRAEGWGTDEPPPETHCIIVTESGVYLRVNWSPAGHPFRECYVDMKTGLIVADGRQYAKPKGTPAYAIEWALLTEESKPRVILSYPFS